MLDENCNIYKILMQIRIQFIVRNGDLSPMF